eukprot:2147713-Pyramimonas_sp.AAC.1
MALVMSKRRSVRNSPRHRTTHPARFRRPPTTPPGPLRFTVIASVPRCLWKASSTQSMAEKRASCGSS